MKLFQKLVCMALTATATASLSICAFAADYTFDTAADTDYYPSTSYEDTYGTAYPRLLEALDVMLELTRVQPGFYSKDGLHEPFLLRFTGNGKGAGYLFSVAWLDAATHIATVPRMKGERIIWISESGSFGEIDLPRHHFFAARQKDGTHRFFGSNEPEKI